MIRVPEGKTSDSLTLSAASKALGISYRKAWGDLQKARPSGVSA